MSGDTSESQDQPPATDLPRPRFSRFYAKISETLETEGLAALRRELLGPLTGRIVEIGSGNGMNFRHYPAAVTGVIAVEPEPHLRSLAERAATTATVSVTVRPGAAGRLPLPDASVDAAVLCLVLCSVADRPGALAEIRRVLRPGGTLHFLEHTIADTPVLRTVQRLVDATFWPRFAGGCHTATDPVALITAAGFTVTTSQRLRFPERRFTQPSTPHVLGIAGR
ncbi:class I SAM-dependent methyltransferase [Microlunatus sp. GCM10028923]|uniref:class I SAM-dependent methyltransferase n=1 Tax=Microlunatus sp. GCM10028923 TaxID=3273400 RepID=UPI0036080FB0